MDAQGYLDEVFERLCDAHRRGARLMRRNAEELRKMRLAGRVVAEMHEATRAAIRRG